MKKGLIKFPVHYDDCGTCIFDADNNMVLDIRGWGRLQKFEKGEGLQDDIGEFVAEAMNEKANRIYIGGTND